MKRIVDPKEFKKIVENISTSFVQDHRTVMKGDPQSLVIVGIHTRGVYLGKRIAETVKKKYRFSPAVGSLDITLYRDDVGEIGNQPLLRETSIPFAVEGKTILLVDDVLYTGRTIRAALDALLELGRPRMILLGVAVERAGRELPIQANYFGTRVAVGNHEEVQLKVKEVDGEDGVWVIKKPLHK